MHLIVGLGNPGSDYENTRHNVGFRVADEVVQNLKTQFRPGKGEYLFAESSFQSNEVIVAKPLTYMNNSGLAVVDLLDRFAVPLDHVLVVCDDFHLPLGVVRLRPLGSDGGHNGLYSIIYHLQSDAFSRLRCGIGTETMPKQKSSMADWVLEEFAAAEAPTIQEMIHRAKEACLSLVANGIEATMNLYNQKEKE